MSKIKLNREKIIKCYNGIKQLMNNGKEYNYKFNYAVDRNYQKLEKLCVDIQIEFSKLEAERVSICNKYCNKDEKGKPIFELKGDQRNYTGLDDNEDFDKDMKVWKEKEEKYRKEEIEIEIYGIKKIYVPNQMRGNDQASIMPFIIENKEEKEVKIN